MTTQPRVLSSVALRVPGDAEKWGARGEWLSLVRTLGWGEYQHLGVAERDRARLRPSHHQLVRNSLLPRFLAFAVFHFLAAAFSEICTGSKMAVSYSGAISSPGCHLGLWPSRHLAQWAGPLQDPA